MIAIQSENMSGVWWNFRTAMILLLLILWVLFYRTWSACWWQETLSYYHQVFGNYAASNIRDLHYMLPFWYEYPHCLQACVSSGYMWMLHRWLSTILTREVMCTMENSMDQSQSLGECLFRWIWLNKFIQNHIVKILIPCNKKRHQYFWENNIFCTIIH